MPRHFSQLVNQRSNAATELARRRTMLRSVFAPQPENATVLSSQQQLERFMAMTQDDFNRIERQRGRAGLQEFVSAMQRLMDAP